MATKLIPLSFYKNVIEFLANKTYDNLDALMYTAEKKKALILALTSHNTKICDAIDTLSDVRNYVSSQVASTRPLSQIQTIRLTLSSVRKLNEEFLTELNTIETVKSP